MRQPAARKLVPGSLCSVYVISRRYPSAWVARHARPYKNEQAFFVPSVTSRVTSSVQPSSRRRATGRPTIHGAHDLAIYGGCELEFRASRGLRVAVEFQHEGVRLAQRDRHEFDHAP